MSINGFWPVFGFAVLGGVIVEFLRWYRIRDSGNLPAYSKSAKYWALTAGMILIGGILAFLYGTSNVNAILAINIGASAPTIISAFANALPPGTAARLPPTARNFLAGR